MTKYFVPKCTLYCFLQGKVFAGPTNMTKIVGPKCALYCFLQVKVLAWPTHMTHDVAPKCTLYCFFARESVRRANTYDQICCSEVYFVLFFLQGKVLAWPTHMTQYVAPKCTVYCFFARESARRANKYDQICCSEVYFALFFLQG